MAPFTGPKTIKFHYLLKSSQGESRQNAEEEDDVTLKEFRAFIQAKHHLEGLVTLWHNKKKLTDLMATLGTVLNEGDTLVVTTNRKVLVAGGGIGTGGTAVSGNGAMAVAEGGFGTGGACYQNGTTKQNELRGGRGLGGDSKGATGFSGDGLGGTASSDYGTAKSGRGTGGQFVQTQAPTKFSGRKTSNKA